MKVILKKRIANLGHEWDIVNVKDGFARNYLLPNNLAIPATATTIKNAQGRAEARIKQMSELNAQAKETADKLKNITLTFKKKARGEKLYGSISEKDIVDSLKEAHKMELDKEAVKMKEPIKTLGKHKVKLHFAEGVEVSISIVIEAE